MAAVSRALLRLHIGHRSEMLDRPTPQGHTHRWTVFVRSAGPLQFTDQSFIKKVVFELHPDFANPHRVIKEPPFEVTETGYAGFSIPIFVSFTGTSKTYRLHYDMNLCLEKQSEHIVEQILEFKQPSKSFYELIMKYGGVMKKEKKKDKYHAEERQSSTNETHSKREKDSTTESVKQRKEKQREHSSEHPRSRREKEPTTEETRSKKEKEREREIVDDLAMTRKETHQNSVMETSTNHPEGADAKEEGERRIRDSRDREQWDGIDESEGCQASVSSISSSALSNNSKSTPRNNDKDRDRDRERSKRVKQSTNDDAATTKRPKMDEAELQSLLTLQRKLMTLCDVKRIEMIVEAIISSLSASNPISNGNGNNQYTTTNNNNHHHPSSISLMVDDQSLSFDLCALNNNLISQLQQITSDGPTVDSNEEGGWE